MLLRLVIWVFGELDKDGVMYLSKDIVKLRVTAADDRAVCISAFVNDDKEHEDVK